MKKRFYHSRSYNWSDISRTIYKRHLDQLVDNKYQDSSSKKLKEAIEHMSNDFCQNICGRNTCRITKEEHKSNNLLRGDLAQEALNQSNIKLILCIMMMLN